MSLSQRDQIGAHFLRSRYLFFQHALRKGVRLNRLQLSCFQVRCAHRLAQQRPRQFQVALRRNQLLLARGHINLGRHPVRLNRKAGLHVFIYRTQQRRCRLLLVLGDVNLPLRVQHLLVGRYNAEHDLLVRSPRR